MGAHGHKGLKDIIFGTTIDRDTSPIEDPLVGGAQNPGLTRNFAAFAKFVSVPGVLLT